MKQPDFISWLIDSYDELDCPEGDLVADLKSIKGSPRKGTYEDLKLHMENYHASSMAINILEQAYATYLWCFDECLTNARRT